MPRLSASKPSPGRARVLRRRLGLCAVLLAAPACVQQHAPGVQVSSLSANIVFGSHPAVTSAAPAGFILGHGTGAAPSLFPPTFATGMAAPKYLGPSLTHVPACPVAGPGVFPTKAATPDVPDHVFPQLGHFRWKRAGTHSGADTVGLTLPVTGFEDRWLLNLAKNPATVVNGEQIAGPTYSFDMAQIDMFSRHVVTTTFTINPAGLSSEGQSTYSLPDAAPSAGDPGRGVSITKIVDVDPKTKATTTFAPATPLLLMPLPVHVGEQFSSVAVDPLSFATAQYQGTVNRAERVDACGQLVEGYTVTGTETFVNGTTSATRTYSLTIAPQYGAMPIAEAIDQTVGTTGTTKLKVTVGQLEPDRQPPPAGAAP